MWVYSPAIDKWAWVGPSGTFSARTETYTLRQRDFPGSKNPNESVHSKWEVTSLWWFQSRNARKILGFVAIRPHFCDHKLYW
jgi:hypothetical protein